MKMRYWVVLEVISGIVFAVLGSIKHDMMLETLGICGTMLPLFHNLIDGTLYFEYKLNKENKYAVEVRCSNCCVYNLFKITNGVSVEDYIKGKTCGACNNELKLKEIST